jgi:ribosomal protein L44E
MKIEKEISTYCSNCNKHTMQKVRLYAKKPQRGMSIATRRHNRAIRGYVGSVEPKIHPKKLGKRQKVMLECTVCKKTREMVIGQRTKKKLEIKR